MTVKSYAAMATGRPSISPTPVTALLSSGPKAAAFAVMLRVFFTAFGSEQLAGAWFWALWISAVLTMFAGNLAALAQTNVKRMLAYSSIAHAGYILVAFAAQTGLGLGDVYAAPRPTTTGSGFVVHANRFFDAPYDPATLPLILPGPHVVRAQVPGTPQTADNLSLDQPVKEESVEDIEVVDDDGIDIIAMVEEEQGAPSGTKRPGSEVELAPFELADEDIFGSASSVVTKLRSRIRSRISGTPPSIT